MTVDVEDVLLVTIQSSRFSGSCNTLGFVKVIVLHGSVDLFEEKIKHLLIRLDLDQMLASHHGPFFVTEKPALRISGFIRQVNDTVEAKVCNVFLLAAQLLVLHCQSFPMSLDSGIDRNTIKYKAISFPLVLIVRVYEAIECYFIISTLEVFTLRFVRVMLDTFRCIDDNTARRRPDAAASKSA